MIVNIINLKETIHQHTDKNKSGCTCLRIYDETQYRPLYLNKYHEYGPTTNITVFRFKGCFPNGN
jgi:hypothetical protein